MLIINPTISTNFQAQKNSKTIKKNSKLSKETGQEAKLCLVLGCLATIAAATIGIKKGRVVSFAEALEKNGVEIKNQIAYIKGTDKKFTGSVSRITKSLAREKETTRFIDGIIHEEIVYNRSGQELRGKFYKDGKLYRTGVVTYVYPGRGSKKTKEKFVIYEEYGNRPYKVSGVTIGYNIVKSGVIPQRGLLSEQMRGKLPEGKRQFI